MGCGKRALQREQQTPLISLVWCNSSFNKCIRYSLSIWPSSLPEHSGNVSKEEEASIRTPRISSFRRKSDSCHQGNTEEKGSETIPPWSQSRQWIKGLGTQQLSWVSLTGSIDMEKRKTQTHHWNLPVDTGKLSCRVSMLCLWVHMKKIKTTCVNTQLWQRQNSCEQVLSTMSQRQPLQITNQAVLCEHMPWFCKERKA